jgi:hypothetical protein
MTIGDGNATDTVDREFTLADQSRASKIPPVQLLEPPVNL